MDISNFKKKYSNIQGIYKVTNTIKGQSIIGSSNDIGYRVYMAYYLECRNGRCHNEKFLEDFKKYGEISLDCELLEKVCDYKDLKRIEENYIKNHNNLYNKVISKNIELDDCHIKNFWSHVDIKSNDECWNWIGALKTSGYGVIVCNQKRYSTHRVSYFIANGPFDWSLSICHKCDNIKCVNPKHLFAGSHLENMLDMHNKNRNGKLTKEMVNDIRDKYFELKTDKALLKYAIDKYNVDICRGTISDILHNKLKYDPNWIPPDRKKKKILEVV